MKIKNPFRTLTKFELALWITSLLCIFLSSLPINSENIISLLASLIGVTALIFTAKGYVIGQILIIIFALLYGFVSLKMQYYGEMITYVCMSAPIALVSTISWLRNPYKNSGEIKEVEVSRLTPKKLGILAFLTIAVTIAFYFILRALGNAELIVSTFSVTTSFVAASLTMLRSPYYALAYALNDVVLMILWTAATFISISNLPMLTCFIVFFANDIYGFINWRRMQKKQASKK